MGGPLQTQSSGDAIFIPNAWWHAVEALGGPAVSISARGVTFCEGIAFLMLGLQAMKGCRILDGRHPDSLDERQYFW